ncbi:MAG: LytTR family transcriptional regulator DNA-binding domain-containing protein [Bacteroidales bacterium]|nr:LytTR family transcriptional regulator DNA-binding domain-containing protein [Bacteroidales bacterium]
MRLIEFQQQNEIPEYLRTKSGLASQIIFEAVFAVIFINIYKPFTSEIWGNITSLEYFLWSLGIVFIGAVVLVVSKTIMFFYAKKHRIFYWVYAVWTFIDLSAMAGFYTLIAKYAMPNTSHISDGTEMVNFFWSTFSSAFFVLLIPAMIAWLYLAFSQKKIDLQKLQNLLRENPSVAIDQPSVLHFKDEKGEVKFSIKSEYVIWIEAADNYVVIKYQNQEKISEFVLRNSLKHLADDLKKSTLFRCHRSFMVNFDHAVALRKGQDGLIIELDIQPVKSIPVSKTYKEDASRAFMQYTTSK